MKNTLKILSCLCCGLKHEGIRKETKEDGYDGYQPEVCCAVQVMR